MIERVNSSSLPPLLHHLHLHLLLHRPFLGHQRTLLQMADDTCGNMASKRLTPTLLKESCVFQQFHCKPLYASLWQMTCSSGCLMVWQKKKKQTLLCPFHSQVLLLCTLFELLLCGEVASVRTSLHYAILILKGTVYIFLHAGLSDLSYSFSFSYFLSSYETLGSDILRQWKSSLTIVFQKEIYRRLMHKQLL